ncbi:MAG TPA: radical SAM protein [Dehalococcoidia bacterium]|nr:radical SAM protein [Dehalococcoidia bacterium]
MFIPFQYNAGQILAVLPRGEVQFLRVEARPLIDAVNAGNVPPLQADFSAFLVRDPLVEMNDFHLSAPANVFLEITNRCNLRCKHCYAWSGVARANEMPTEQILRVLDDLDEMGTLGIFLTGGEVFSHRDAVQIIQHAKTKAFAVDIFTNGLLITEEKLAQLPRGTSFAISFDTADPERTVRGGMDFPKLRRCFEWMAKYGHVVRTAISVHRNNIHDALDIYRWCLENGYPRPQWLETHPLGRALLHPDILLQPEQVDEVFAVYKQCMELYATPADAQAVIGPSDRKGMLNVDTVRFTVELERATGQEKCARSVAYINAAGEVYPCTNCQSAVMYRGGNLRERSFKEIWDTGFRDFRTIHFSDFKDCNTCPVAAADVWCQFRCPPVAMNLTRNPLGCGATEYMKLFMLKAHRYWQEFQRSGKKLALNAPA